MDLVLVAAELAERTGTAREQGQQVGLVPTMGALHDGHVSLVARAVSENDLVVVSVFVNPLQFGEGEDFERYPRDLDADLAVAERAGAAVVFAPPLEQLYPLPTRITVHVSGLSERLEGAARPGHFDGVATVLTRLFGIVGPSRAYFGEKDYQQLVVVRRLVGELCLPIEVRACPTVREEDGVARSSRNAYLSEEARALAPLLSAALRAGAAAVGSGERDGDAVRRTMAKVAASEPGVDFDYLEVADPETLESCAVIERPVRLLAAARVGGVRLIDNLEAVPPGP